MWKCLCAHALHTRVKQMAKQCVRSLCSVSIVLPWLQNSVTDLCLVLAYRMRTERANQRRCITVGQKDIAMPANRVRVVAKLCAYEAVDVGFPLAVRPAGRDGRIQ